MHILSKICLGAVVLLSLFGFYEAAQLAKKRNAIAESIVAEKNKRDKNIAELASARITRAKEVDELNRLMADWGRQWTAKGQTDVQQAAIVVNVGPQQGLGQRPDSVAYVFSVQPNGSSMYLGEFKVAGQNQTAVLTLNGPRYPQQMQQWPAQGDFRVRERIPPGARAIFHDLGTNQTIADQIVINETAKSQIQDNHIAASQKTLDRRLAELNGDPAAPQIADREIISGLVDTLRVEEAQRNVVLKDVDTVRRQLSDHYAKLERVLAENKQAVDSLATGTETAATTERTRAN